MPLEHRAGSRLTAEQRDRVLDLAARLQAQHESTVDVDELARMASEAGIDPRFVYEATEKVVNPRTPAAPALPNLDAVALVGGLGAITLVAFAFSQFSFPYMAGIGGWAVLFQALYAALHVAIGYGMGRRPMPLWMPATSALGLLWLLNAFFLGPHSLGGAFLPFQIAFASALQAVVAVLAGSALARVPRERL